jgi:penicillin-binding protein 2
MTKHDIHIEEAIFDTNAEYGSEYREVPTSRVAFFVVISIAVLFFLIVCGRIGFLSVVRAGFYEVRASANVGHAISLPTHRAVIVDRYGELLAKNASSFSVYLNTASLFEGNQINNYLLNLLSETLLISHEELGERIKNTNFETENWIVVARGITSTEAITVRNLDRTAVRVVDDYVREYIDGPVFSHVIGYTGVDKGNRVKGILGMEAQYDERIRGTEGRYIFYEDAHGEVIEEQLLSDPIASEPLELTIDKELQMYFYEQLRSGLAALGRDSGIGIAIRPNTGEILALMNAPSFDNNIFVNRSLSDQRSSILNDARQPLFNRAVTGKYSPGSTIKPLVALAALHEGIVQEDTRVFSAGTLSIPNPYFPDHPSIFLDWKAHGWVDIKSALARSSNIYFYAVGGGLPESVQDRGLVQGSFLYKGLGIERLKQYWEALGFKTRTGIDIPGEETSFLPDPDLKEQYRNDPWRLGDTYNVSIGQGDLLITPLQLASFIASIGNGGIIYRPFLKKDTTPEVVNDYSDWTRELSIVREGLEDAVNKSYGTAHSLSDIPISIAGKTGSAQTSNNAKLNALFIGYAPAENPEIAILVLVENAREGSLNTLPIARNVFNWYYQNRILTEKEEL